MSGSASKATVHVTATGGHYVDLGEILRSETGRRQLARVARIRVGRDDEAGVVGGSKPAREAKAE